MKLVNIYEMFEPWNRSKVSILLQSFFDYPTIHKNVLKLNRNVDDTYPSCLDSISVVFSLPV